MLIHDYTDLLEKYGKLEGHLDDMRLDASELVICLEKGKIDLAVRLAKQLARRI